eukprot:14809080-Heterocapsa_arctica.AAC.1
MKTKRVSNHNNVQSQQLRSWEFQKTLFSKTLPIHVVLWKIRPGLQRRLRLSCAFSERESSSLSVRALHLLQGLKRPGRPMSTCCSIVSCRVRDNAVRRQSDHASSSTEHTLYNGRTPKKHSLTVINEFPGNPSSLPEPGEPTFSKGSGNIKYGCHHGDLNICDFLNISLSQFMTW